MTLWLFHTKNDVIKIVFALLRSMCTDKIILGDQDQKQYIAVISPKEKPSG